MRKRWVIAPCLLVFLAALFAPAGCGRKSGSEEDDGMALFSRARQVIEETSSFRVTGVTDTTIGMSGSQNSLPVTINIPMEEEIEQSGGSIRMRSVVDVAGSMGETRLEGGAEDRMVMYLIDDRLYFKTEGRWYYSDYGRSLNPVSSNSQLITPESILRMMDYPESLEVVDESDSMIKYHLLLGEDYYRVSLDEARQSMPEYPVEQYESLVRSIRFELDLTVSKASGQVTRLQLDREGKDLEFMQDAKLSYLEKGAFDFSDYGKAFDIRLPEEAKGAEYVDLNSQETF